MSQTRFLVRKDVEDLTSISTSTIYDMMKRGAFPRPVKIGLRRVAWVEADVQNWITGRLESAKTNV